MDEEFAGKLSEELMMFYNVENLFIPDTKPVHKLDPTKSGLRNWDEKRYQNKLFKISHVLTLVKEQYLQLPFLIGLAEIQGKKVLNDLLQNEIFTNYQYIHYESMDERGVDVALLYDSTKIEIEFSEPISFLFEIENQNPEVYDTTRDVLHCRLKYENQAFHVFVLHLPSKREKDINLPKRDYITKEIGKKIAEITQQTDEAVIVMGDFNANPDEKIFSNLIFDSNNQLLLNNPFFDLYNKNQFSTFYHKNGLLFDQILLSQNFYNQNSKMQFHKAEVFQSEKLSSWDRKFKGRPFRTYSGTRYLGGYSDHFPVIVRVVKKSNSILIN